MYRKRETQSLVRFEYECNIPKTEFKSEFEFNTHRRAIVILLCLLDREYVRFE